MTVAEQDVGQDDGGVPEEWLPDAVHAPSREDPLVRRLSAVVGGPAGARLADPTGLWRAVTVLVALGVVVLALAVTAKAHCLDRGWSTPDQFVHMCYSDLPALYGSAGLGGANPAALPHALTALAQPPLAGALMWLVAQLVPAGKAGHQALWFFDASVVVIAIALVAGVIALAMTARRRGWDAAHLALSPVLVTAAFISYDLLAVALIAWALFAWSRRRVATAGVLLGTAVAVRPVYAFVGVALLALALRSMRWRRVLATTGIALGVWLAIRVVLLPGYTGGLSTAWDNWRDQGPGFGSIWFLPDLLARARPRQAPAWIAGGLTASTVTVLALTLLVAVVVGALLLALATSERPRLAHVALFLLAGALLVGKTIPPQAGLLLLPLIALSALRWRDHLLWAGAELTYFAGVWLYIAADSDPNRGLPPGLYAVLIILRAAALIWIMTCAVRTARNPLLDPVRCPPAGSGSDDPLGGDLEEAPDALVVRMS